MSRGTSDAILRQVKAVGCAVSVFRIGDYVELHAVRLSGDEMPHVSRCEGDGDGDEPLYFAACALAEMVGVRSEE